MFITTLIFKSQFPTKNIFIIFHIKKNTNKNKHPNPTRMNFRKKLYYLILILFTPSSNKSWKPFLPHKSFFLLLLWIIKFFSEKRIIKMLSEGRKIKLLSKRRSSSFSARGGSSSCSARGGSSNCSARRWSSSCSGCSVHLKTVPGISLSLLGACSFHVLNQGGEAL